LNFHEGFLEKKGLQYQISRKSVQWEPRWSMQTDRQTEGRRGTEA